MTFNKKYSGLLIGAIMCLCLMPFISPAIALGAGIMLSLSGLKNDQMTKYTSYVLQASIVLMGFGMNLTEVISASKAGFIDTALSVFFVMTCGLLLGKLLKVDSKIAILISAGTAICGGSAIAAVSSVLNPKGNQISFSLIVIFILNAIALIIFPIIGHKLNLSQETFGYWAALAIHDTSSVVGAGATYGAKALEIATTVKLIRALWIIPLSLVVAFCQKDDEKGKIKFPWFIGLFVLGIVVAYLFPEMKSTFVQLQWLGKRGMVIAIFLIGTCISFSDVKEAGIRSFVLGISLWLLVGGASLFVLMR